MSDVWLHLKIAGAVVLVIGLPAEIYFLRRYYSRKSTP